MTWHELPYLRRLRLAPLCGIVATGGKDAGILGTICRRGHAAANGVKPAAILRSTQFGHAAHQALCIGVLGVGVDGRYRPGFYDLTGVHHPHMVADTGDHAQIMGDVHDGRIKVALEVFDEIQDDSLHRHIERGGRLVHDEKCRVVEQGHGDDHPLLLPARDLVRVAVHNRRSIGHIHPLQHLDRLGPCLLLGDFAVSGQYLGKLFAKGQRGIQGLHGVLIDHRDPVAAQPAQLFLGAAHHFLSLELDAAVDDLAVRP